MLRLNLRTKLILSALVVLAPVLILLIQNMRAAYDSQKDLILADGVRLAQIVSVLIDDSFDEGLRISRSYATDPVILGFDRERTNDHLARVAPLYPDYDSISVFDAQGNLVGSAVRTEPINVADRQYFQDAMATGRPTVSGVIISRRTGMPIIALVAALIDPEGRREGIIGASLNLGRLTKALENVQRAEGQHIYLVDRTGRLAFHTGKPDLTWEEREVGDYPPVRAALEGRAFQSDDTSGLMDGRRMVVAIPTPKYGWVVGVSNPVDVALAQWQESLRFSLVVFAGVVVMSLALALTLAELLLRPVRLLADHAIALGRGQLQRRVRVTTGDELEGLGEAFNAMAEEVQRALQLREEFLTVAAHELRTPLTIIKGYSQWLLAKEADEEKQRRFRTIVGQANRIGDLLDEMLTVSELRGGRFELHQEQLDLASLAREVVERMQLMTDKHRLLCHCGEAAPAEVDRNQLEAVLTNLVDNAIRYSPKGGPSQGMIEVAVAKSDDGVTVSVRDQGLGIPADKQKHVFEPFFQIYPAIAGYGGLGLGLFISKEIVERHGGRIWFESTEGVGSTFYFSLPRPEQRNDV